MLQDITCYDDIHLLTTKFYTKVRKDTLIGPIFNGIIKDHWPEHIEKISRFWETTLFNAGTYSGSPFGPHAQLPIQQVHFDRWIQLFSETVKELHEGKVADEALWRANKMATTFVRKIAAIQNKDVDEKEVG